MGVRRGGDGYVDGWNVGNVLFFYGSCHDDSGIDG
jgi:hypothetical protein